MIVINIPVDANLSLPPEPRPRPTLHTIPPSPAETSSGSHTPLSPSSSRRLFRRVHSMPVASLLNPPVAKPTNSAAPASSTNRSTSHLKALKYHLPAHFPIPPFAQSSKDVQRDLARLYEAVSGARRIAVICGAGISVSSPANIPDFRSAHGLFNKLKQKHPTVGLSSGKDLFDARLFSSNSTSALFYSMVAELKRLADQAEPTIFHRFLKRLDQQGRLQRVYTQNIDGLEQKAGLTFGLGDAGDSTTTLRALGKRKSLGASAWSRSKSDSHLLFAHKQQQAQDHKPMAQRPMFPRTIPLHGTLQTLTCALCNHKLMLANTVHESADYPHLSPSSHEGFASLGHQQSKHAMELLQNGEAVPCPRCKTADEVRSSAGMRSRGVGSMKVDIVLYGGQNEGAERVGQCLQRDILGLRDPNEPPVPESAAEMRARQRKEKKEADKLRLEQQQQQRIPIKQEPDPSQAHLSIDSQGAIDSELGAFTTAEESKHHILARAFADDADGLRSSMRSSILSSQPAASAKSITIAEPTVASKKKSQRPPRLKPLPPDLLIVAGTSLKVPGTKRIVREFAKACHAQDEWLIYSSDDQDSSTAEDAPAKKRAKDAKSGVDAEPKLKADRAGKGQEEQQTEEAEDGQHGIHDPSTPIRTILLNYDFPNPAREWEDVFDVWIQGDLQRAALSLFPRKEVDDQAPEDAKAIEQIVSSYTWAKFNDYLEEQRELAKKEKKKKAVAAATAGSLGQRKGRLGRTVSAAAKMERTAGTQSSSNSTPDPMPTLQVEAGTAASKAKAAKARSRSESPHKKRPATASVAGTKRLGIKGGMKRSNSKKNPFLADQDGSNVIVDIPTIAEEEEGQGKDHDDGVNADRRKELPSSSSNNSALSSKNKRGLARCTTMSERELMVLVDSQDGNACQGKGKKGGSVSSVYGKGRGNRSGSVSSGALKEGKRERGVWARTQSETVVGM